jgi:hypothetical protein
MTGKYRRALNVNFLPADSSVLKLDEYLLQLLATSLCEKKRISTPTSY